jgi:hypothetical protein
METERLRTAQIQAERMLETRERSNRTKIKGELNTRIKEYDALKKSTLFQSMHKIINV